LSSLFLSARHERHPHCRQLISRLIRIFSRAILFFVGLYKIDERRLADETAEMAELDGAPYMLVSNHVSYLDITYHFARDAVAFVAKIEVRRLPIIGRIAAVAQCIFTSRAYVPPSLGGSPVATGHSSRDVSNQASSVNDPHAAVGPGLSPGVRLADGNGSVADEHAGGASSKIARRLQQRGFPPTLLFPEGTTSNNCALLRFRTGAFIHGAPVKPVLLQWCVVLVVLIESLVILNTAKHLMWRLELVIRLFCPHFEHCTNHPLPPCSPSSSTARCLVSRVFLLCATDKQGCVRRRPCVRCYLQVRPSPPVV